MKAAWSPIPSVAARSHLGRLLATTGSRTYEELCRQAAVRPAWFWEAMVKDLGIIWRHPYETVLDTSPGVPFTRWFPGGRLNAYDTAVSRYAQATPDRLALISESEDGTTRQLTFAELDLGASRVAEGLRSLGVERGEAVGLFLPLVVESALAVLACTRLGAVVVPMFSGFGADAIRKRLADAEARVLITADGAVRRGRPIAMRPVAEEAAAGVPSVERIVVVSCLPGPPTPIGRAGTVSWAEVATATPIHQEPVAMRPDEPLMLLYTSGTTGRPKGTVHGHAGLPIKSAQDWAYSMDAGPGDRFLWVTDMGWVMGPLLLFGTLMRGGTAVFYDGAIDYPDPGRLWAVAARHRVTHLGISPTAVRVLMTSGDRWPLARPLPALRILASTGEPWTPEAWQWLFDHVGRGRLPIINYSGGTECAGGLLGGNVLTPSKPGSFAGPIPGIDAAVFNEQGQPVRGEVGELVVRQPFVGMTLGFWKDPDRYLETYWSRWPGVWMHGDWALVDGDGQWFILGRSDDTIKVAGKRVGPAEVEAAALDGTAVAEAAAVGVPDPVKGEAVVVFAVAKPEAPPGPIPGSVAASIERSLGKPFKPAAVFIIPRLPKTRNGKILRRLIRKVYLGEPPGDLSSIDDLASLDPIRAAAGRTEP